MQSIIAAMASNGDLIVRLCLVAVFTMFILLSGFLLPSYLRGLQNEDLKRIKALGGRVGHTIAFNQAESSQLNFRFWEYVTPVAFAAFIVLVFSTISLFGTTDIVPPDYILGGAQNLVPPTAIQAAGIQPANLEAGVQQAEAVKQAAINFLSYEKGTMVMIIFAFFGAFIWSVQYILGRIMTRDVAPAEFYRISLNIIFAIVLGVAIRHSISVLFAENHQGSGSLVAAVAEILPTKTEMEVVLPTVGFLVGMFPNFFREWLVTKVRTKWFGQQPDQADPLRLTGIEGLTDFAIFRLNDLEIRTAQSLAFANPVSLYMRTRFGLAEAIDWVSQAQLMVLFKFDKVEILRKHQIRTIVDLAARVTLEGGASVVLSKIAEELGTTLDDLRVLVECIKRYPAFVRLQELRDALAEPMPAPETST
jgi:hypothetical protein